MNNNQVNYNWEDNEVIVEFNNTENPNKELVVEAYFLRDLGLNLKFKDVFFNSINKLDLNPENFETNIQNEFKFMAMSKLRKFFENPDNNPFYENLDNEYHNYVQNKLNSQEYTEKRDRYNILLNFYNNEHRRGFYNALTLDELISLGW